MLYVKNKTRFWLYVAQFFLVWEMFQVKVVGEIKTHILLTYSTVQSRSWEANWFAASQEIPRILWNPKVHYRTHKRPPPLPILGQPNPVHIPTSHLLEIHPNITYLLTYSMVQSPSWEANWFAASQEIPRV